MLVIQGHPDATGPHLCDTIAVTYAQAARDAGHDVRVIRISDLDFPLLRSKALWESAQPPPHCARRMRPSAGAGTSC